MSSAASSCAIRCSCPQTIAAFVSTGEGLPVPRFPVGILDAEERSSPLSSEKSCCRPTPTRGRARGSTSQNLNTGTLEPGEVATVTVVVGDQPIQYICTFHDGMKGTIVPRPIVP